MKKLFYILAIVMLSVMPAAARKDVYRDAGVLPAMAQQTLKKNFPKAQVNRIMVDKNIFGHKDYEVILNNGTEIEFNKEGEWEEVDCGHKAVPQNFILEPIRKYIAKNHKKAVIVKIEKDDKDYDLELSDGTELKFSRSGQFIRYDD